MLGAMRCELVSWERFDTLACRLARTVRAAGYQPDVIVAIARGGYMPARVVADHLGVFDLADLRIEHYRGTRKAAGAFVRYPLTAAIDGRRVLLVDDVSDSGETFEVALRHLNGRGRAAELRTAVLHHKTASRFTPDYHAERVREWRWITYPWALMEDLHSLLQALDPPPRSVADAARRLRERHGIDVPPAALDEALRGPPPAD